ncbi:GNAT family N-acetyltransferase [Mycoplasma sp. P36-A1]|uniref:GNAT family N-acetyltransferase n=1 Tax=Mycoplasma sp. P36-A1 TaxID=3252900 RepID=UPI003C30684F
MIKYTKAVYSDVDTLIKLYDELINVHVEIEPDFFKQAQQSKAFLELIINNDDCAIIIARENNKAIGFVLIQTERSIRLSMMKKYRYAYLTDLYVSKDYRNQGIATHLIEYCYNWAYDNKLDYVELNVYTRNEEAIKLYEKLGYRNKINTYIKKISY